MGLAGAAVLLAVQLVPYGHDHPNPLPLAEPSWDSPATRQLAKRACFNCHSFETEWPWYAAIAPASWLVFHDVHEGRRKLNFSTWQNGVLDGESPAVIAKQIRDGEMPPWQYLLAHPEARLSPAEKKQLSAGLQATVKRSLK
jgi:mono/diheme cytochrome c family protein